MRTTLRDRTSEPQPPRVKLHEPNAPYLRDHPLAAAEHARQQRNAATRLDRLLGLTEPAGPPEQRWECPGELGPDGKPRRHCGRES